MVDKTVVGNIFDSKAQTIVNTVNCVGVMGKGLALQFKRHFPDMYKDYVWKCKKGEVKLGRPYLFKHTTHRWILLFPTKDDWRSKSKLSDIEEGLKWLKDHYEKWGIKSLAVPPLGCGLGGLDWGIVKPILNRYLNMFNIPVEVYVPEGCL